MSTINVFPKDSAGGDEGIPLLPLRDIVVFPHMIVPLFVGRPKSIAALEAAMQRTKQILLVAQKDPSLDDPLAEDLYSVGTLGNILNLLKLPDGTVKVLVEGEERVQISQIREQIDCFDAVVSMFESSGEDDRELEALMRSVVAEFEQYVKLNKKIPPEILMTVGAIEDPARLADTVAAHLNLRVEGKQELLEIDVVSGRLERLLSIMEGEIEVLQVERRIRSRVKRQMEKSQREYYLNEQMKAIQKELGDDDVRQELGELEQKINAARMPRDAEDKARSELKKLKMMSPMSAEATVVRNYVDWLVSMPWKKRSRTRIDLKEAAQILDDDHFGLEKVKERIIEYLAVLKLVKNMRGPILCLVGPPGVGKSSLARSIARATNRKFIRLSLGGVRDEAEIRGHRRTYIGALPGKLVQSIKKVQTKNPMILLDEIDKMGADFRGDPSSAMLEVLDPEQNKEFVDHYLEVEFDLSEVMFIATANSLSIPRPLMDRMEIIRLSGYTEVEKAQIARRYLIPKSAKEHGLKPDQMSLSDAALLNVIRLYTREAGVRNLEREIATICRKVARTVAETPEIVPVRVTDQNLEKFLGIEKFRFGVAEEDDQIGVVTGLAWTEVGGELLTIEAVVLPGKGRMTITGKLGDVMQESIQAAMSYVRSRAHHLGLEEGFHQKIDIHIHVPEGAIPKDGPSAGLAMATAIVSALTRIPVRREIAMTGEITLRGRALPIGGLKEKLLAAMRGGIAKVMIPNENAKDLREVPAEILESLEVVPVGSMDEVLSLALLGLPQPRMDVSSNDEEKTLDGPAKNEEKAQTAGVVLPH
ncbi:MAG: endopeptidase La [Proteobacteria bacterium CG1_02_64_396]|nr:MAG: endopeptidase La [Proteobacteria bacterium CG1_02_64_396]